MALFSESHGDGFPLLVLHWFSVDRTVTAAAMEPALADQHGWRRVYVDLPGCGNSPPGPENSDGVLAAVDEFVEDSFGAEPFLLAGFSYGGYIATGLARRRRDQIAGLLLTCSGVKIRPEDRTLPGRPPDAPEDGWLADVPPRLHSHLTVALGRRTRHVATRVADMITASNADEDYLARLRSTGYPLSDEGIATDYPGPACIITGREDRVGGYEDQFRSLTAFPNAAFAVVAQAGHWLPFEQPESFRALVHDWLRRCRAA